MRLKLWVLLAGLFTAGCSSAPVLPTNPSDPLGAGLPSFRTETLAIDEAAAQALLDEFAKRYTQGAPLLAGDKLEFRVVDHPEVSFITLVPLEGWIDFPSIGKVVVAGRSLSDVRAELTRRLGDGYLVNPNVSVLVQEYAKRKIYVLGAVAKPGDYELPGGRPITLMQAISQALGFKDDAERRGVLIFRPKQPGGLERIVIPVDVVSITRTSKPDPLLLPEDTVLVPERERIYVFGQVIRGGGYLIPSDQPTTITKAISMAGGFTRIAKESSVRLTRRQKDGTRAQYVLDIGRILDGHPEEDVQVQPGDVIFVPESFW